MNRVYAIEREESKNYLIIPSILVDSEINEGPDEKVLKNGVWRRPFTSVPSQGGNTVLVAHRFLYTNGPKTFYHLNKIKINDKIVIFWEGSEYEYRVSEVLEVGKDEVWVEDYSDEAILTLYTCTPLWTAEKRLVVRAKLLVK